MFAFGMFLLTSLTNLIAYRLGQTQAAKKYGRELAIERSDYVRLKLERDRLQSACSQEKEARAQERQAAEHKQGLLEQHLHSFQEGLSKLKTAAGTAAGIFVLLLGFAGCDDRIYIGSPPAPAHAPDLCDDGQCQLTRYTPPQPPQIEHVTYTPEVPAMNLPRSLRTENWAPYGEGSCAHASTVHSLRWQGLLEEASYWRSTHHSGETISGLSRKLSAKGILHAYTDTGDTEFLEWASRTRRGAVIWYYPAHAINFLGYHDGKAWLLDNNRIGSYITEDKATFIRNWKGYGGVALSPTYSPTPPLLFMGT